MLPAPLLLAVTVIAGCANASTPTSSRAATIEPSASASASVLPRPDAKAAVVVGKRYAFSVGTHCGVDLIGLDGSVWQASPKLGDGNPPPGWDSPSQDGVIQLVSKDVAVFEAANGQHATFTRLSQEPSYGCA
jgi:hypothetical protein